MQRLKQNLLVVAGLTVLGITGLFMNSTQVAAQNPHPGSAPVNIVSPLPLPVTGSLSVSGGTVAVSGTVNVRDVDKAVSEPFQENIFAQVDVGIIGSPRSFAFSPVPAGKRLIIEHVSANVHMFSLATITMSYLNLHDDLLTLTRMSPSELTTNLPTKVIVESGESPTIRFGAVGFSAGPFPGITFDFRAFISGTLVPAP